MRRRELLALACGAAASAAASLRLRAQPTMPVIGLLCGGTAETDAYRLNAFKQGLSEGGYNEGRNVAFEYRWAELHYDRLPALATELVQRKVDLIASIGGIPSAIAAKASTASIPILIAIGGDPVQLGLVASLNRPGANVTGVSFLINAMGAKQLETLHQLLPAAELIAFLWNPANPNGETDKRNFVAAAESLHQKILLLEARNDSELEAAFAALTEQHAAALVVGADFFLISRRDKLVQMTATRQVPAVYPLREFTAAGGLMSYGTNLAEGYRLVGTYAVRILKGEKPADLPVQQSTKVELTINLKAAKALGLGEMPNALLGRADEVIE
jgi:putative tryptophan/tyrosine transport system substrate-binding protein